jgi:hypothetical protein
MSSTQSTTAEKTLPCRCLRTKNSFGIMPRPIESRLPGTLASSSYWCLLTQGPAGPDEHYVHQVRCIPGRICYEAPDE